jgi:hypothetical protein
VNRRNFISLAVAAALAPVAFARKPDPYNGFDLIKAYNDGRPVVSPATYTWWRNHCDSQIDVAWDPELAAKMRRAFIKCMNDPAPPNLIVWRA